MTDAELSAAVDKIWRDQKDSIRATLYGGKLHRVVFPVLTKEGMEKIHFCLEEGQKLHHGENYPARRIVCEGEAVETQVLRGAAYETI